MIIVTHNIVRNDIEHEVESSFQYHRPHRGHRDKYGCPEEPDEEAEMEYEGTTLDGAEIQLTDYEITRAEMLAWKELGDI
jgi:hypothetical protein